MPQKSTIIQGIHYLKIALECFEDFKRQYPKGVGVKMVNNYSSKINWILNDLLTCNTLPERIRTDIRNEINSDVLAIPEIMGKISMLKPIAREAVEDLLDSLLSGAELTVETHKDNP
jgi:hypothetical protein